MVTESAAVPTGNPSILLTSTDEKALAAQRVDQVVGQPFGEASFRDVILDCAVTLASGHPSSAFGLYLRQSSPHRYVLWTVTPQRRFRVGLVDRDYHPVHDAPLGEDIALDPTTPTRLTVVAFGPSLTFVVNSMIVTGAMVPPAYAEGVAGVWLQCGDASGARLILHWVQVRAVLPDLG